MTGSSGAEGGGAMQPGATIAHDAVSAKPGSPDIREDLHDDTGADGPSDDPGDPPGDGRPRRRRRRPPRKRLSEILHEIASDTASPRISLLRIMQAMEGRAYGALILIFALPNALPAPPGLAGILGLPLIFLAARMMLGLTPWLPDFISHRSIPREGFAAVIDRANPWLKRAERLLRHRWWVMTSAPLQQFLGLFCLVLTVILILPVPFGNLAPSLALCIIGLGVLERDGVWVAIGLVAGIAAGIFVGSVAYALVRSAIYLFLNAF